MKLFAMLQMEEADGWMFSVWYSIAWQNPEPLVCSKKATILGI